MVAENNDAGFLMRKVADLLKAWDSEVAEHQAHQLKNYGYDPVILAKRGAEFMAAAIKQQRQTKRDELKSRRIAAQAAATEAAKLLDYKIPADVNKAIQDILAGQLGPQCQNLVRGYFRNLQEASLEDKIQLLRDIQLLNSNLISKPANQDGKEDIS